MASLSVDGRRRRPARVDSFFRWRPIWLGKVNRVDIFGRVVFKTSLVNFEDCNVLSPFHSNFGFKLGMSDDAFHLENHIVLLIIPDTRISDVLKGGRLYLIL